MLAEHWFHRRHHLCLLLRLLDSLWCVPLLLNPTVINYLKRISCALILGQQFPPLNIAVVAIGASLFCHDLVDALLAALLHVAHLLLHLGDILQAGHSLQDLLPDLTRRRICST